jgi:hypothetical protein
MNKKLTLLSLALAPLCLNAQITINQNGYASWTPGTDSIRFVSNVGALPSLTPTANASWDLSTSNYTSPSYYINYSSGTSTDFPAATYQSHIFYEVTTGIELQTSIWTGNTASGIERMGEDIERQAFSLAAVTFGPNDSLVFPEQTVTYSAVRTDVKFPATMGSQWFSAYDMKADFNLTIASFGFNNSPGYRKSFIDRTDSVKGWGRMRLKNNAGVTSAWMNVLQVKSHVQLIDSFYLDGLPIPENLLTSFGLGQGMETHTYTMDFYREGEVTPLTSVDYANGSYSSPQSAVVHTSRHANATGINEITNAGSISVYPNPISGNRINVSIDGNANGNWGYKLVNVTGQTTAAGTMEMKGGSATINLNGRSAAGVYYLQLVNDGIAVAVKTVVAE